MESNASRILCAEMVKVASNHAILLNAQKYGQNGLIGLIALLAVDLDHISGQENAKKMQTQPSILNHMSAKEKSKKSKFAKWVDVHFI